MAVFLLSHTFDIVLGIITDNAGISVSNTAVLTGIGKTVYSAITGDQVAITNIHIK